MERIVCDTYMKDSKPTWNLDAEAQATQDFNRKILAVNNMYGWLYQQGLLEKVCFQFKDYSDMTFFAFDAKDVAPFRNKMLLSGIPDAALAVSHILDEHYSPCLYSGAIQLGWTMRTYREFDGTVGRSWECGLLQHLDSVAALDVEAVKQEQGVRAAVSLAFELSSFEPSDLIRVRALTEDDRSQVALLDNIAGNYVQDFLDAEDYAWGLFLGNDLVGYCTIGGADDSEMGYDKYESWSEDSLLLSDVFIKEEHRGKGYASHLINEALDSCNPDGFSVFLTVLDDGLYTFYEALGFDVIGDGSMVRNSGLEISTLEQKLCHASDQSVATDKSTNKLNFDLEV